MFIERTRAEFGNLLPAPRFWPTPKSLRRDLSTVKYCVLIKGNGFKVRRYESEIDYSDIFGALDSYCTNNLNYLDERISRFDREIHFYISYLEYMARFKRARLQFCYPLFSDRCKAIHTYEPLI